MASMNTQTSPLSQLEDPGLLKTEALIGGAWVTGQNTQARFVVTDPATGAELAQVANLGAVDCAAARRPGRCGAPRPPRNAPR